MLPLKAALVMVFHHRNGTATKTYLSNRLGHLQVIDINIFDAFVCLYLFVFLINHGSHHYSDMVSSLVLVSRLLVSSLWEEKANQHTEFFIQNVLLQKSTG